MVERVLTTDGSLSDGTLIVLVVNGGIAGGKVEGADEEATGERAPREVLERSV